MITDSTPRQLPHHIVPGAVAGVVLCVIVLYIYLEPSYGLSGLVSSFRFCAESIFRGDVCVVTEGLYMQ
jgi:hypothetical protein